MLKFSAFASLFSALSSFKSLKNVWSVLRYIASLSVLFSMSFKIFQYCFEFLSCKSLSFDCWVLLYLFTWKFTYFCCWLCWGLTSQSTIFQLFRDGAIASWVIYQYFRGVKCLAQGHNTAAVGFEPPTSRSGVRHSTTEPQCSPTYFCDVY